MDHIEILVYVYAGLFALTFTVLIGLYVWMYTLSKQVKSNKKKNPYEAFLGTQHTQQHEQQIQESAPPQIEAVDLYRDYKMKRAQVRREDDEVSYNSRHTRANSVNNYDEAQVTPNVPYSNHQSRLNANNNFPNEGRHFGRPSDKRSQLDKIMAQRSNTNNNGPVMKGPQMPNYDQRPKQQRTPTNLQNNFDLYSY